MPRSSVALCQSSLADLVGFTPYSEAHDSEEVRETLDGYFEIARNAIERHGGTIEKFIGDAVMAVWGAPIAREDDAERAVRAALELVDAVTPLGVQARAGVLTGEAAVNVGAVGEGMVVGDIVNTAARLQSVAAPGTVLVGESTYRAASASIAFEPAGEQSLKGKASPVPGWRALRIVAQRGGKGRSDLPEPPFVGRDEELRLLKDLLAAAGRDRRTRLVSITGPGGIGKSRLAWELEKYLDGLIETVYWHRGRSPAYGDGITFWALGEMVRRRARLTETDDEATTRKRIEATVAEFIPDEADRRWVEPALLTLLGLEPAPPGGRDVLFAAWRIFFERIAARGTTVLVFEDLHWADTGLLDFVDHLLEWSKGVPILVVTLARPELFDRRPDWGVGTRNFSGVALEPLPEAEMRALIAGLVPGLPERAVRAIVERADGVPLYAVETVRMLVAEGRLERADDGYRPVGELGALAVPENLRSLITSRLEALEAPDRSLIGDASVLGQTFTLEGLVAVTGRDRSDLEARLRGLVRRELVEIEADPRSPERGQYRFVQSLTREVAHGTLARRERRPRHLAAARYFEALGDDELAGALATHYVAAYEASAAGAEAEAVAVQARLALRGAAERAATLGAHDQAVAYLEQALSVTTDSGEQADLLERAATSADAGARYDAAADYARRAKVARASSGDRLGAGRAQALLGYILIDGGDLEHAISELEGALGDQSQGAAPEVEARYSAHLSRALFRSGAYRRAIEVADRALELAERLNDEFVIAEALLNKAAALDKLGRRHEAVSLTETALRLAAANGWIATELRARNNLGFFVLGSEPRRAADILRDGLALAHRVGDRGNANWLAGMMATAAWRTGRSWDEALAAIDDALAAGPSASDRARLLSGAALLRIPRGEDATRLMATLEAALAEVSDPQTHAIFGESRSDAALVAGDLMGAYEAGTRVHDVFAGLGRFGYPIALRAAAWDGSLERARAAAEGLGTLPEGGAAIEAVRIWADAVVATLEGRRDAAISAFTESRAWMRDLGLDFELALTGLDMVLLLGAEEPQARSAAEEARVILVGLRATPYLARLEAALSGASPAPSEPTAPPTERVTSQGQTESASPN